MMSKKDKKYKKDIKSKTNREKRIEKLKFKAIRIILSLGIASSMSIPVFAVSGNQKGIKTKTVTAVIPVSCTDSRVITLTPDKKSPMAVSPKGQSMKLKNSNGTFQIVFHEPGKYHYTVSGYSKKNVTRYRLNVEVTTDDYGNLKSQFAATKDGKYKSNISFGKKNAKRNISDVPIPERITGVKTGDNTDYLKWIATLGSSMLVLAVLLSKNKKKEKRKN